MNKKKVIIIGAGGNAEVIASTIDDINKDKNSLEIVGFFDDEINKDKVLGKITKKEVDKFKRFNDIFFIWSLRSVNLKANILQKYKIININRNKLLTIKHPSSIISSSAKIGNGVTIQPLVNIGPNVTIKDNVHIFSQAMIGHNTTLENFSYIANNSSIGAFVKIKEGGYIGMNSTIKERIDIDKWSVVGMGSVVINNVKKNEIVAGNPAKKLK
jgi:acetyltransferase EpsM